MIDRFAVTCVANLKVHPVSINLELIGENIFTVLQTISFWDTTKTTVKHVD